MNKRTNIVIADEQEMIRDSLYKNLSANENYNIQSNANDGYSAIKECQNFSADILIIGNTIKRPDCFTVIDKTRKINPDIRVVAISEDSSTTAAFSLFSAGAIAVVSRSANIVDFLNAVRSAELGYACLPSDCIVEFTAMRRNRTRTGNIYGLSPRELEVMQACADGANTKEVAHQLSISIRTVEAHRNAIYRKTECKSVEDIKAMASRI